MSNPTLDLILQNACKLLSAHKGVCNFSDYGLSKSETVKIAEAVNSALSTVGIKDVNASVTDSTVVVNNYSKLLELSYSSCPMKDVLTAINALKNAKAHIDHKARQNLDTLRGFNGLVSKASIMIVDGKVTVQMCDVVLSTSEKESARAA